MLHPTKDKGDLAVAKVILNLIESGYQVLTPTISEHLPFDLIAVNVETFELKKIQVKYCKKSIEGNSLKLSLRSSYCNTEGVQPKSVDYSVFDFYAIYNPEKDKIAYLSTKLIKNTTSISISFNREITKNNHLLFDNLTNPNLIFEDDEKLLTLIKLPIEPEVKFSCPYCGIYRYSFTSDKSGPFLDWKSVRYHTSKCAKNDGSYIVDLAKGPIKKPGLANGLEAGLLNQPL